MICIHCDILSVTFLLLLAEEYANWIRIRALAKYGAPPEDKRLSSLLFESHANLAPKAVFYVCGWDPRRDEALLFGELLEKEGVAVKSYVYPGLPHGFWTTCPDLEVSRAWERDLIEGVGLLLR